MRHSKAVVSLDIETAKTSFAQPEKSKLAFVGVELYFYRDKKLYSAYKHFAPSELGKLREFLINCPCVIIGHNIFNFDFRVLRNHMDLRGIVEKSVDTLHFLRVHNGNTHAGLSLKSLCIWNELGYKGFNRSYSGMWGPWERDESVSKLWNSGERRKVYKYNKNDCTLTYKLWNKILDDEEVLVQKLAKPGEVMRTLFIPRKDRAFLTGRKKSFTYDSWISHISSKISRGNDSKSEVKHIPIENCLRCGGEKTFEMISRNDLNQYYWGYPYYSFASKGFCRCGKCRNQFLYDLSGSLSAGVFSPRLNKKLQSKVARVGYGLNPIGACPVCGNLSVKVLPEQHIHGSETEDGIDDYSEKTYGVLACKKCGAHSELRLYYSIRRIKKQYIKIPGEVAAGFAIIPEGFSISGRFGSFCPMVSPSVLAQERENEKIRRGLQK